MAAKILIERKIKPDQLGDFLELSLQIRSIAMRQKGYISGETLGSVDNDGTYLVISSWRSLEDWKAWERNSERAEIAIKIDNLLDGASSVKIYVDMWGSGN